VVDRQGGGLFVTTINYSGYFSLMTQAAARTFPYILTDFRMDNV